MTSSRSSNGLVDQHGLQGKGQFNTGTEVTGLPYTQQCEIGEASIEHLSVSLGLMEC